MRSGLIIILIGCFLLVPGLSGCAREKGEMPQDVKEAPEDVRKVTEDAAQISKDVIEISRKVAESSKEAIEIAKSLATVKEKSSYLIAQANTLYNSKKFQDTVDIAQYILNYLDKDSQEAMSLLEKAKKALVAKAQEAVGTAAESVEKKIGGLSQ